MSELKWATDIFSKEENDNKIWENWTKASFRSNAELAEVVYGPYQEEFQKRALFLLLVPDTRLAPFSWLTYSCTIDVQGVYNHLLTEKLDFGKIEAGLRSHAVYWLTKFIDYTKYQLSGYNGQVFWLDAYNEYIIQLLAVVPREDNSAENLFPYFAINDSGSWIYGEEHSGYNPLLSLWKNPLIPEIWKRSADAQIRPVIKNELMGNSHPRRPWESALKCYVEHLQFLVDNKGPLTAYLSRELFADQINFLISLEISDQKLIKPRLVGPILDNIHGNAALKWKFCRFVILRDGNFKIFDEQTEEAAKKILEACGTDSQVTIPVRDQLTAYQEDQKNYKEKLEKQKRAEEALLAPMRKICCAETAETYIVDEIRK